ncbi:MAG: NAD-dependent epimerase/dehydratase family protein, partial [Candidatus Aenigmarchaeota archaeon]|nr:NAD-dependent epimerase/dehydratase family protein [Candidatus Aenigmarchaeota archaeon]
VPQVHLGKKPEHLNPKAKYVFGDIRDKKILAKSLEGVEIVFHEAAEVGVGQSMYQVEKYTDVNTLGTAKLLDFLINSENSVK